MKVRKVTSADLTIHELTRLQWGRTREGAEGRLTVRGTRNTKCFSGAAPVKVRKVHIKLR